MNDSSNPIERRQQERRQRKETPELQERRQQERRQQPTDEQAQQAYRVLAQYGGVLPTLNAIPEMLAKVAILNSLRQIAQMTSLPLPRVVQLAREELDYLQAP